jgi:hypothetical protein
MKKTLSLLLTLFLSSYSYSQNLYITKRDYSNSSNYIHSLDKINSINGSLITNYNFITPFPSSYSPESLSFNYLSNEIFGISDNLITKNNITTNNENSIVLPLTNTTDYGGIVIANNNLFVAKRDFSNSTNYVHSLQKINQNDGSVISNYNLTTNLPTSYNNDLKFSISTNEIFGKSGNVFYKYNVTTGVETNFTLPIIPNTTYNSFIIAENRLFMLKRDYGVNPIVFSLLELNQNNGSIINTYNYTTNLVDFYKIINMTFLADSHEICFIIENTPSTLYKVVKLNINTNNESFFELTPSPSSNIGEIVSTVTEQSLSIKEINLNQNNKIIKAFNLLGQEIPIETYNQIIIVKFENGETRKLYNKK